MTANTHVVREGETPATIAIFYAGCPKCSRDLVVSNPQKKAVVYPNGYTTFADLKAGDKLNLPDKWFNGELDTRPTAYFAALPSANGVSLSSLGDAAAGILSDYATLDSASAKVGALSTADDQSFSDAVGSTATLIDNSVKEVPSAQSQPVRDATAKARLRGVDLVTALTSGDKDASFSAKQDILHDFSDALLAARTALQAFYVVSDAPPTSTTGFPTNVLTAAQAAASAIAADSGYCSSVSQNGSAVNAAIHAFKIAWNSSQTATLPVGTGGYETSVAAAIAKVLGAAPKACGTPASSSSPPTSLPLPVPVTTPPKAPYGTAAVAGIGLLSAGVLGGVVYFATQKRGRKSTKTRKRTRK